MGSICIAGPGATQRCATLGVATGVRCNGDGACSELNRCATGPNNGSPPLYYDITPWYRLVDPPADHANEVASYQAALERAVPRAETLLELGAGAGHNAFHLKKRFRCTLNEPSTAMETLSRELNPDCEHVDGDMRTLRLNRTFDAVLVHDAVMYMTSEVDLIAAATTAFLHTRPGGAAVIAPDCLSDTFAQSTELLQGEDGSLAMRGVEWKWDPDPSDTTFMSEYSFLLRDGTTMTSVHDRHLEGLFSLATWMRILTSVGYQAETFERPRDDDGAFDTVFLCRRP